MHDGVIRGIMAKVEMFTSISRIVRGRHRITIRRRLFIAFILMVLLPAVAYSVVSIVVGFNGGRKQVINQLQSVASLKEAELNTWANNLKADVANAMIGDESLELMRVILSPSSDTPVNSEAKEQLRDRFGQLVRWNQRIDELFLMDFNQRIVLSSDLRREGSLGGPGSPSYFQEGLKGEYLHPPSFEQSIAGIAIIAVRPVYDKEGRALGILAGRAGVTGLSEIMLERSGLEDTGETYLVTENRVILTEPRFYKERWARMYYVFSAGANTALEEHSNGYGWYDNYSGDRVIGVFRWLPELRVVLLAEQHESEALGSAYVSLCLQMGVALASAFIAGVVSFSLSGGIASPLADLAATATKIASGDLALNTTIEREDEIGVLACAFFSMTTQLRNLINSLEERVRERTEDLRLRALQLQTSMRVSREITAILDIDKLLVRVVKLINETFGYYFTGISMVDEERNILIFRAGSGEADQQSGRIAPVAIELGSLNGEAALYCQAIISNDVSQDPRYMPVSGLPDTRSELVVPLRVGNRVIGTLDVQSARIDAFCEEDLGILQSLGDQVAVAIENARLVEQSREAAVLEERTRLARELHDSVTQLLYTQILFAGAGQEAIAGNRMPRAQQHLVRIENTAQQALKEMRLLFYELRSHQLDQDGLVEALRQRLDAVEERVGIETQLTLEGSLDLPAFVEKGLYCIAQEALNNALKHANASRVVVQIRVGDGAQNGMVELSVEDNGTGFNPDCLDDTYGMGLAGMRVRAESLNGVCEVISKPGQGTRIIARVRCNV
ncbi:MAG: GAF domain-containing protein [Anaerolineales bacterium]|nr:GAF domain-containing protein [Anaerolineales bacterium]